MVEAPEDMPDINTYAAVKDLSSKTLWIRSLLTNGAILWL
jgi:hypothetical protein